MLSLEVPPVPLFKNEADKNIIHQQPLYNLLKKFDGQTKQVVILISMIYISLVQLS